MRNSAAGTGAEDNVTERTAPRGAPDTDAGETATNRNVLLIATPTATLFHYPTAVRIAKGILVLLIVAGTTVVRIAQAYSVPKIAMEPTAVNTASEAIVRRVAQAQVVVTGREE